jgi:hypothetical protein
VKKPVSKFAFRTRHAALHHGSGNGSRRGAAAGHYYGDVDDDDDDNAHVAGRCTFLTPPDP